MAFSLFRNKRIYADWAATTPLHPQVVRAMLRARRAWANPNAIHAEGVVARKTIEEARSSVARLIGAKPEEVYFMSGGTEANATFIQGVIRTRLEGGVRPENVHVVSTSIEHSSVLETLRLSEKHGVQVTYVDPGSDGIVREDDVLAAIRPETALVTCMFANNEIGTVQPVSKIGAGIRKIRAEKLSAEDGPKGPSGRETGPDFPIFHTDASQAPLWLPCDIEGLRADAMTLDAHKMQGPKGVGALVVRRRVAWEPLMVGGGQERGKRPTTESVELITGFAEALSLASEGREPRAKGARQIRDRFFECVEKELPEAVINGSLDKRLPNNANISIPDLSDPELAVLFLDKEGIACSTKSSCLKGEEESYVVKTLGAPEPWRARNTIRFSFAPNTSEKDVLIIVEALKKLPKIPQN
ncbi:MAG TPA: cysteine desulfurase family protein [Candidatus Paceibacterota bacterium]|nr:cysteine desulfurase family protein [Candidatus Paceibacterota bacterium]